MAQKNETFNVNQLEDIVSIITNLVGGIDENEELYIEIEVRQLEGNKS